MQIQVTVGGTSNEGASGDIWDQFRSDVCTRADRQPVGPHTHRMHIPVGLAEARWHKLLDQRLSRERFAHARWAARNIARNVETARRTGRWNGNELVGHCVTNREAWDYFAGEGVIADALRFYQVAEEHHDVCQAMAMKFLGARNEKRL